MTLTLLQLLYTVVLIALAIILIRRYVQTRNIGYVVLALALPLWFLLSWAPSLFFQNQIDRLASGKEAMLPFSMLDGRMTLGQISATFIYGTKLVQVSLILLGFLLLSRSSNTLEPPKSAQQPTAVAGS